MINVTPVILCGGSGTRLWPLSRTGFPKQFLCLTDEQSLFQHAILRTQTLGNKDIQVASPMIVTSEDYRFLVSEQLREIGIEQGCALLEPEGRNTAPALTLAALAAMEDETDPVLVVTPSDQTIANQLAFTSSVQEAVVQASEGVIVVLGIGPDCPETGYGYIQIHPASENDVAKLVSKFVEKPDEKTAKSYLSEGGFFWNSGMFVIKASIWLKALSKFRPDILQATIKAWSTHRVENKFIRFDKVDYIAIPSESVDYAVMEKCPSSNIEIKMIQLDAGWSDLGAWDAVWNVLQKDDSGNALLGDVITTETRNTLAYSTSRLISLVGVQNLVVIETPDAILVADITKSQDVKFIVSKLKKDNREEHAQHRKVHRPWGWYDSIDQGGRFKVKRIQVKPKASLSLQKHKYRAEHWIVVTGTAEITNGEKVLILTENQSTYIPLGELHRITNPGTIPLEIIEVQSGEYLGEDDIIRFEDKYGRAEQ